MNILIAYATKSGAARVCAELLAEKLENAEAADLSKGQPNLGTYDTVIVGSGIRMGRLYRPMVQFMTQNKECLLGKRLAVYCCSLEPGSLERAVNRQLPQELVSHALCVKSLGGIPPFSHPKTTEWLPIEAFQAFLEPLCE